MLSFLLAGILCLTFDDSGWENWVRAMPLFERYHAHATFFPCGALSTNALACLRRLEDAGHTVGSHSLHHRDATTYFEEVSGTMYCREEVAPHLRSFASVGMRPKFFAYPNNRRNADTDAQLSGSFERFRAGSGLSRADYYSPSNKVSIVDMEKAFFPVRDLRTHRVMGGTGVGAYYNTDIDDICRGICRAAERDEVFVLFSHDICEHPNRVGMPTAWLEKILKTAADCDISVRGFGELGPVDPQESSEPMMVTLTFDDNVRDHLLVAAPELEKRGWTGLFSIVTDWVGRENKLNWDEIRELVRRGHEIAVHTRSHHPCGLGALANQGKADLVREEIAVARDIIERETGVRPRFLCLPGSGYSALVGKIVREEGLAPMLLPRACCGEGMSNTEKTITIARGRGFRKYDLLVHGVRPEGGGWKPFPSLESFLRQMQAIEDAEKRGLVKVLPYGDIMKKKERTQ